jgi:hypothetical protein
MIANLACSTRIARAFRRTALPLAAYYAVTLGLPLANGAARSGGAFIEHALVVLAVPPIVIVVACAVHSISRVGVSGRPHYQPGSSAQLK